MPAIRKCAKCGENTLISSMGIFKASRPYQCTNCDTIIKLTPLAMLGMQFTVLTALSIGALSWLIFFSAEAAKLSSIIIAYAVWIFMSAAVIGVIIAKIRNHSKNPYALDENGNILQSYSKFQKQVEQDNKAPTDSWIESKSLLFGLISPVILIAIIIAAIGLLYYIDANIFN
ncbi:MAG: hypothetical protein L3J15_04570 [Devosiaceae bacterium]|nr:hypothetical protein [Devosiaceae bacterium]